MVVFPKKIQKHFYNNEEWAAKKKWDTKSFRWRDWVLAFFEYATHNRKSFYWSWDKFMIVIRFSGRSDARMVIEIPIDEAPYLIRKQIRIGRFQPHVVLQTLSALLDDYASSMNNLRNSQSSTRTMSFRSFLDIVYSGDVRVDIKERKLGKRTQLSMFISWLLETTGIKRRTSCPAQQGDKRTLPQVRTRITRSK